jgi:hypothetical protein
MAAASGFGAPPLSHPGEREEWWKDAQFRYLGMEFYLVVGMLDVSDDVQGEPRSCTSSTNPGAVLSAGLESVAGKLAILGECSMRCSTTCVHAVVRIAVL